MDDQEHRALRDLSVLMEKARRRGGKLEKTLVKIVSRSEPGSAAEGLLKTVQAGLKALRKEFKERERSASSGKKKAKGFERRETARDIGSTPGNAAPDVKRSRTRSAAGLGTAAEPGE